MRLDGDERAAAIQVGAVILFSFVIVAISLYQAQVVPDQNGEIEFDHNEQVQRQLVDLRSALQTTGTAGGSRAVAVDLGTTYPARTIFQNPADPTGTLRTVGTTDPRVNVTISGANATGELGDYWNGTPKAFSTGAIVYRPDYTYYTDAPTTVYEHSLVYNRYRAGQDVPLTGQTLVQGSTVTITTLNGTLDANGRSAASVDVQPVSVSTRAVEVKNESNPINITVPTLLSQSVWEERLNDTQANVTRLTFRDAPSDSGLPEGAQLMTIHLRKGTYQLRLAKVGVGSNVERGQQADDSAYVDTDDDTLQSSTGENVTATVVVRDQFNNPVSGETVTFTSTWNGNTQTAETGADGTASVSVNPTDSKGTYDLDATIDGGATAARTVTFEISVSSNGGGGGGGGGGNSAYDIVWSDPSGDDYTWNVTREGSSITLTAQTDPAGITSVNTDFALNNSSVATIASEESSTGNDDKANVSLNAQANGTVAVYVSTSGSSDTINVTVTNVGGGGGGSNSPPSANFGYSPSDPDTSDSMSFDGSSSSDSDGSIASFQWDFGDGTTATGETTNHSYSDNGTYTVTLTVTDDDGATDTVTRNIQVDNVGPTADFTYSPTDPDTSDTIGFDGSVASDSDGSIDSYSWDFDEGTTATGESPSHSYDSPGSYTVTLTVTDDDGATDTVTKTVTVRSVGLITAVEVDADRLSDSDGEFVRLNFSTPTDTTGWVLTDGDTGQDTALPATTIDGTVYFARNPSKFANTWGIDPSRVYELETQLENSGEALSLIDASGTTVDEFGYNGVQTSNGWEITLGNGDVAVRKTDASGDFQDTNTSSDWTITDENTFFGGTNGPPALTSVSVSSVPWNQSDTGDAQTITLRFNETMNTSVQPTVGLSDLVKSSQYNTSLSSGTWLNDTAWQGSLTLQDDNEDVVSTISVAGAEDEFGATMETDTSNTITVDTKEPQDPTTARITTDPIVASNQTSVTVEVDLGTSTPDDGTVYVRLVGPDGNTATGSAAVNTGGQTTTVSGIDVSTLSDGKDAIAAEVRVVDDVGNENPSGYLRLGTNATKDTTAPQFDSLRIKTNPGNGNDKVASITFDYTASDNIQIDKIEFSGVGGSNNNPTTFSTSRQVGSPSTSYQFNYSSWSGTLKAPVDVTLAITDSVGNTYTCTGTLNNKDSEITLTDMSCSSTQASLAPLPLGSTSARVAARPAG